MRLSIIRHIQRKELTLFFASAIGYLFLGAFLLSTLFAFFWLEAFFARNIADVRPLFEWLPVLLVFLTAALTMRMWSEERRTGTLEFIVTMPVSTWEFVLGKFFACWILLGVALLLTLPIPVTVSLLGNLDWGPVFAGYVAAMLMGGAYLAIGLFVSARTDSQIVSLIGTVLICGVFYLLGSPIIAELFGGTTREVLVSLGSGSRFESIVRGVLDARDLYFYISILVVFLALNVYGIERGKWAQDGQPERPRAWQIGTGLLVMNLLLANVWLSSVSALRFDLTQGRIYSISSATHGYLRQLQEPLLIRGYFSEKTHPLLAPLVPQLKDLLKEYAIAGGSQVQVELLDPVSDPEIENEANTKYGIRAVPFQVQDRHQASLVNSYLDVLIQYGDEYEVLGFQDLIEVKVRGEGDLDVQLKNPEFDITRAIKQALYGFQGGNSVFANIGDPVQFVGYISSGTYLPEPLKEISDTLMEALNELAIEGGDKFSVQILDPDAGDGQVAFDIAERLGFQPMAAGLFDDSRFYFYLTLQSADTIVQVPLPEGSSTEAMKKGLEEGLKRFAAGLLKTVAVNAPVPPPPYMQQQGAPQGNQFAQMQDYLSSDFTVTVDDLSSGGVPQNAELLLVLDPGTFDDKQLFAVDQFLMKGGTVVVAAGRYSAQFGAGGLSATPKQSRLFEWLAHAGVDVSESLVMDPQNSALPVPVPRQAGGFTFQDIVMLDYPYFLDVRGAGLQDTPITQGLEQVTVSWASPIQVSAGNSVAVTELLYSSSQSWLSTSMDVSPKLDETGGSGYVATGEQQSHLVGVALEGRFESYFSGQQSPLLDAGNEALDTYTESAQLDDADADASGAGIVSGVIERSPESARLIVFSSNDFVADQTVQIVGSATGTRYLNSAQLVTNVVDWALEDQSLIGIRGRGNFNRTLPGMEAGQQSLIEYINYGLAFLGTGLVMLVFRQRQRGRQARYAQWLKSAANKSTEDQV